MVYRSYLVFILLCLFVSCKGKKERVIIKENYIQIVLPESVKKFLKEKNLEQEIFVRKLALDYETIYKKLKKFRKEFYEREKDEWARFFYDYTYTHPMIILYHKKKNYFKDEEILNWLKNMTERAEKMKPEVPVTKLLLYMYYMGILLKNEKYNEMIDIGHRLLEEYEDKLNKATLFYLGSIINYTVQAFEKSGRHKEGFDFLLKAYEKFKDTEIEKNLFFQLVKTAKDSNEYEILKNKFKY